MLDAIEKLRKRLTANKEADLEVESLMEDRDFKRHMKREEFEKTATPIIQALVNCCNDAIRVSGLNLGHIHVVELIGEASRVPIVTQVIKQVFNKECMRTLNS